MSEDGSRAKTLVQMKYSSGEVVYEAHDLGHVIGDGSGRNFSQFDESEDAGTLKRAGSAFGSSSFERRGSITSLPATGVMPRALATLAGVPLCLVMVGLPARGKSYLTKKLVRYLGWRGFQCKEFNAGNKRRDKMGGGQDANFFNGSDTTLRDQLARDTFEDLVQWLKDGGHVAIFDATNTTVCRRTLVTTWCKEAGLPRPIFIESICSDPKILDINYALKLQNADYKGVDPDTALADFKKRVEKYEAVYEPLGECGESDDDVSYIKLFNVGSKVIVNNCYGFLMSQIVAILQNFHIGKRRIFVTRHGQSEDNVAGRLGGDSSITLRGKAYARKLREFIKQEVSPSSELMVISSVLRRALQTCRPLKEERLPNVNFFHTNQLNEINAGKCDGMTYGEVETQMPKQFELRKKDKLSYRYPAGESYVDVISRLNPLVLDIERQRSDVLVISHQACIRALMGYFLGTEMDKVPYLEVPLHCVLELVPAAYKCDLIVHDLFANETLVGIDEGGVDSPLYI
mmetsp:Transcript_386/g.701  ORF Transcript_386/g.701 Transcript_386/m.701 type:complete len:516 (-) Transcript_386:2427-3974(-)|eukprot:CAMPEP_0203768064 /NCGR_PEP_ID=MMETSP0099_2-20121227/1363_1 /ASSEMBLY_ACC=CAM_ASM_000209 /TAXON_ID=96639 /ORGANISM=" , Strain NY0313808BC1" /LENGTH=515 /DNA_ID=CAMNT_0050664679 /DNA_START=388 /DNA_END=1935 /DNA_ORIENTATION=-